MEEKPTSKLIPLENRPTLTHHFVAFVEPLKGELDTRQPIPHADAIVKLRFDRDEREPSHAFRLEREYRRGNQIQSLTVPEFRLNDPPVAQEDLHGVQVRIHPANVWR
jgi:hypothetical protein